MLYLDSSATVKLLVDEEESPSLARFLGASGDPLVTSRVGVIELHRVARRIGADPDRSNALAVTLGVVEVDDEIESIAIELDPRLRALDAIHLASALMSRELLRGFLCYDRRLADAATREGLRVIAPGAET
ncbi:MAG: type II toxin-antitoxin system VapC family toxin [Actinobacteria bacterium]|nr:type II toxin-antitoxin system VapC family toxin [Actinomycetota bacterium]